MRTKMQIEIDGVSHTIKEWAKISGLTYQVIYERYKKVWKCRHTRHNGFKEK